MCESADGGRAKHANKRAHAEIRPANQSARTPTTFITALEFTTPGHATFAQGIDPPRHVQTNHFILGMDDYSDS